MKRCPTCQRTYTDQNLSYCIEDGTPLVPIAVDDETTAVSSRRPTTPDGSEDWNAVAYRPPGAYVPPDTKKRRAWPWVLGIIGVLVLAIAALAVGAAIFLPAMMRRANQNDTVIESSNRNSSTVPTPRTSPQTNSNSEAPANANVNANANANTSITAPTDKDLVLAQLTDIEHEWMVANLNADKKKLQVILADDYVGPTSNGGVEGKRDYIQNIQRDRSIQKWEFQNLKVTLRGDRATLTGQVSLTRNNDTEVYDFTDKFVWRDGRWQATGSVVTRA